MNILGQTDESSPDLITASIYIGNLTNASNKEKLKELGITHILICGSYIDPVFPSVSIVIINQKFYRKFFRKFFFTFKIILLILSKPIYRDIFLYR